MTALEKNTRSETLRRRLLPLILTATVIIADQITKAVVIMAIPRFETTRTAISVLGDFLRFIHVQNPGIALSIGRGLSADARRILFIILPVLVIAALAFYYVRSSEFTRLQRWAVAGIFGGGVGNLIDRIFRPEGVVDWIDFRFYGIFGWERFPTFNVADMTTTICGIILLVTILFHKPAAKEGVISADDEMTGADQTTQEKEVTND
jgi:signal peptidase II